jgi:hypothetical protein
MTIYVLFKNNTDCSMNKTVATKTGEVNGYNAAMQLFKDRRIPSYHYVMIFRDITEELSPHVVSNYFGEINKLGGAPWIFDLQT